MAKFVVLSEETRLAIEARLHKSFKGNGLSSRDRTSILTLKQIIDTAIAHLEDYQAIINRRLELYPDDSEEVDQNGASQIEEGLEGAEGL